MIWWLVLYAVGFLVTFCWGAYNGDSDAVVLSILWPFLVVMIPFFLLHDFFYNLGRKHRLNR